MKLFRFLLPLVVLLTFLAAATNAHARVGIETSEFPVASFNGLDKVDATCTSATPSFFCGLEGETLTRVATKGLDFFFTPAGELAATFAKQQRGQNIKNYNLDTQTSLIPFDSVIPALALLVDGAYVRPETTGFEWSSNGEGDLIGTYRGTVEGFAIERVVTLTNGVDTIDVSVKVSRTVAGEEGEQLVQLTTPGIGRTANPVVKIGHGTDFSLNPPEVAYPDASYAALQMNNNNRGYALLMVPGAGGDPVEATFMRPNRVAFQAELEPQLSATTTINAGFYAGHNELVRYSQEGYLELPGLFKPNILGRLSLAIVWVLEYIHQFVPSWGLSIIVLTLLFRALVWPLITTQTKSMFGMQKLQPKLQEMQRKYKDDKEKLTQETMKLYREAGVNPAGGCLPILLQMPLFIILWRVFVNFEFNEGFLWLPDLGQSDPFYILPVLYVLVMLAMSYFSARGNPQMLKQSMIINLVFVFIIINFPAGVLVYYVVSMFVQVFQYWLLSRGQPAPAVAVATTKRGK